MGRSRRTGTQFRRYTALTTQCHFSWLCSLKTTVGGAAVPPGDPQPVCDRGSGERVRPAKAGAAGESSRKCRVYIVGHAVAALLLLLLLQLLFFFCCCFCCCCCCCFYWSCCCSCCYSSVAFSAIAAVVTAVTRHVSQKYNSSDFVASSAVLKWRLFDEQTNNTSSPSPADGRQLRDGLIRLRLLRERPRRAREGAAAGEAGHQQGIIKRNTQHFDTTLNLLCLVHGREEAAAGHQLRPQLHVKVRDLATFDFFSLKNYVPGWLCRQRGVTLSSSERDSWVSKWVSISIWAIWNMIVRFSDQPLPCRPLLLSAAAGGVCSAGQEG